MPERFHQLVPTLRHWSIEDLHERARLDPVLHDVPLNPLLRRRVRDRPWPHSARLFLVEAEELWLGSGGVPGLRRVVLPVLPWGAVRVMLHCSQDHLQRKLLVPPVHAQPTVTATLRCSTVVIAMHRHVDHWARTKGLTKKETHTGFLWFFWFFWFLWFLWLLWWLWCGGCGNCFEFLCSHETTAQCCDSSFSVRVAQLVVPVLISTLTPHAGLESYQSQTQLPS